LLRQAMPGNPIIMPLEEIDAAIIIFKWTKKSVKNASKLYHTNPPRDPAIPELADLLRRKRQARKNMHNFNRAADRSNTTS
jgi:hypothetical protein